MAKRESYTSKGERPTVTRRWKKVMRKDVTENDRLYN